MCRYAFNTPLAPLLLEGISGELSMYAPAGNILLPFEMSRKFTAVVVARRASSFYIEKNAKCCLHAGSGFVVRSAERLGSGGKGPSNNL